MLNPVPHLTQSELLSAIVRQPLVVTPDTTVMAAIDRMSGIRVVCAAGRDPRSVDELHLQARSSCVSIVEDGHIIGILTERDIVRLSAQQRDLGNIAIRDVMTTNVVTLRTVDFTDIFVAVNLLHQHHIRHLPVVDDLNCLVGLVTHESLQQSIRPIELYNLAAALETKVLRLEAEKIELLKHRTIDLEFQVEERTRKLTEKVVREQLVSKISTQIRSSLNLTEILDTAVRELQSILGCDRVSIWKFQSDNRTLEVVADWQEHVGANLGQQVYDPCFSPHAYRNGKIHIIPDLYTTEMSACHRDLLADLNIRSKILVPILTVVDGSVPWGLISAIESDRARDWQTEEIALLQALATQMAIAIRQAIDYERVHNLNAELESRVAQRTAELQESQQFLQTVFDTFPLAVFWKDRESRYLGCNYNFAQAANLRSPAEIVGKTDYNLPWGAIEGAAYRADDRQVIDSGTAKLGIVETQTREDDTSIWLETNKLPLRNLNDEIIGVLGTYQEITERKSTEIQLQRLSKRLSLSLKSGAVGCWEWDILRDCLIWDERMYELYGVKKSSACEDVSFWLDTIHPEDRAATEDLLDRSLLGQADFDTEYRVIHPDGSIHFIKAYGLLEKVGQDLSYSMIGINFDITAAKHDEVIRQQNEHIIQQQAERESVLREITQRIRRSLDVKTIFETAVREIRQFMETDRVAILKFAADLNFDDDEFVAESVDPRFEPILGVKIPDPSCGEKLAHFDPQRQINVLENSHLGGLPANEIEVLAKFQVQANLVVPLLNGQTLWGSICIHHCAAQRSWQESEINFVNQIAEQIGIAIQQATLYEQVQLELEIRWQAEEAIALQLRQQQTLGSIAQQIRNSLKIEEILATATVQVKDLMMVDRVSIFRVFPNGHLQAVEEVVSPEYPSVIARNWTNQYLSQEELEFYSDGQPHVVVDLQQDPWSLCLQAYIEEIHVQSKIVVPILLLSGNSDDLDVDTWAEPHLWGLLSIQSCSSQRHWQQSESKLLQQIADQLAIAIHQANLFEKLQQELTERQQAQSRLLESNQQLAVSNQQLARATRLKDEFLASMSHELRTPLNAILGMSESLQDEVFGDLNERQHKSIATIEKSGKHLLALINDILDLSKIAANKFKLELTDVSIQSLCQNSILFVKELAHKRQIQLKIQVPEPLKHLNIRVDDLRFRQVLINLLSNAVKFTPEQGSITLDVRVLAGEIEGLIDGGIGGWGDRFVATTANPELIDRPSLEQPLRQIAFSIIDTGIGIAPENMDKLFESFVQIDSSLSRQYAGTGLGLSLVKRIVEMHQGHVSVQSEVNRGSCFTVCLPFCPSPAIVVPPSSLPLVHPLATDAAAETLVLKSKTAILLVEDDEGTIETMTTYLDSRGYRLIVAENGQQAISLLTSCADALMPNHCPDMILMDIQMPGMDGFEAIGHIRQISKCATVPIIALTALAMPDDCQKCLDAGADRYMSKPVRLSQLVATIESLLKT